IFFVSLFNAPQPTQIYTLSLHDALPIYAVQVVLVDGSFEAHPRLRRDLTQALAAVPDLAHVEAHIRQAATHGRAEQEAVQLGARSEEHTSELQSRENLVCRLLLEKKQKQ